MRGRTGFVHPSRVPYPIGAALRTTRRARVECRRGTLGLGPNLVRQAIDISETGLRVLLEVSLARGEEVEVVVHGAGVRPAKRFARVVWSAVADGGWQVGLAFERPLPYHEVQNLARPPRVLR